jgi:hypothetical protein
MRLSDPGLDDTSTTPLTTTKPLIYRCLALTGSFETGKSIPDCFSGLSGDFDGQGISFGVLQWNFGQKSLQPLLREMRDQHPVIMKSVFRSKCDLLLKALDLSQNEIMQFARDIQHPVKHFVYQPWREMFVTLGRTSEFQDIETYYAHETFDEAIRLCREYELGSERAAALMFDIKVQNGSIASKTKKSILADFEAIDKSLPQDELEVTRMRIVANRRADAAKPKWAEDVRARKLCCANGSGIVHGKEYDLDNQFGISLKPIRWPVMGAIQTVLPPKK